MEGMGNYFGNKWVIKWTKEGIMNGWIFCWLEWGLRDAQRCADKLL